VSRLVGSSKRRAALVGTLLALAVTLSTTASASTYSYDANRYHRYVSNGSWWTHSTMTNSTSSWASWRVSLSTKTCFELSGAVTLAINAGVAASRSSCTTRSRDMSTSVAPWTSAALMQRAVVHFDYYFIRKIDRYTGRTVDSGYATRKDSFTDYAFSSHY
jgi:hypothetical protein